MSQPPVIYPANTTSPKKGLNYVWSWLGSSLKSFAAALSPYMSGGGGVVETTYPEVMTLMSSGSLVKGATYKINGFNKNMPNGDPSNPGGYLPEVLYDDGNNSGITIYVQALNGNELATSGYGEFYNPKYGDASTYNNTDGTGLYRIWDGNNPIPANIPAYQVDDVVFWGGYAWKNLTGMVGVDIDILNLDSTNWEKLPYSNSTWYELVVDEIKVDWNFGILIERYNPENQVRVAFNANEYYWNGLYNAVQCSPISVMAWGLYSRYAEGLGGDYYGIGSVEVINSYCETVSFKGIIFGYNKLFDYSFLYNNYFGKGSYVKSNTLNNSSYIINNTLDSSSYIDSNTLDSSYINSNTLDSSNIINNTLDNSTITTNTLDSSNINSNTLDNSSITNNTLDNSSINSNTLDSSNIIDINNLDNSSAIYANSLTSSSLIFTTSGTLSGVAISSIRAEGSIVTADISSATDIYGMFSKYIFKRQDGQIRMSYYDNTDTLQVVMVDN